MNGIQRRREILDTLRTAKGPLSGTSLAETFSVSRQVIVQDMALIRAEGHDIISTSRGYLIQAPAQVSRTVKVLHTSEEIADELYTIVDLGGTAEDVSVRHRVYGRLRAELKISSRLDVHRFLEELKSGKSTPLKDITSGYHYHTILADSEETLDLIQQELGRKGYLCR
ncbi:MAG: transcription repressor NadR [Lachnospiraceae bacterium]|jgi:transcriptional regulator of NAD metabolism|nr:transcription repressor NadR [Lachnospiraceae bacterium]